MERGRWIAHTPHAKRGKWKSPSLLERGWGEVKRIS
jgi:hypothetical protein